MFWTVESLACNEHLFDNLAQRNNVCQILWQGCTVYAMDLHMNGARMHMTQQLTSHFNDAESHSLFGFIAMMDNLHLEAVLKLHLLLELGQHGTNIMHMPVEAYHRYN